MPAVQMRETSSVQCSEIDNLCASDEPFNSRHSLCSQIEPANLSSSDTNLVNGLNAQLCDRLGLMKKNSLNTAMDCVHQNGFRKYGSISSILCDNKENVPFGLLEYTPNVCLTRVNPKYNKLHKLISACEGNENETSTDPNISNAIDDYKVVSQVDRLSTDSSSNENNDPEKPNTGQNEQVNDNLLPNVSEKLQLQSLESPIIRTNTNDLRNSGDSHSKLKRVPQYVNVHQLMNSVASAGFYMIEQGVIDSSIVSFAASSLRRPDEQLSIKTGRRSGIYKLKDKRNRENMSKQRRNRTKSLTLSSLEYSRPSSSVFPNCSSLSSRHPFLHPWECVTDKGVTNRWASRREVYLTLLLAAQDTSSCGTNHDLNMTTGNLKSRSGNKRPLVPRRDFLPYHLMTNGDHRVTSEVALQDRALTELEPSILGYRWDVTLTNEQLCSNSNCESMLLWN